MQTRVDPARDMIYVNGNRLPKKLPPKVYLALNKPKGCVTVTCPCNYFYVPLLFNVLSQVWALNPMCICGLMRLQYHRYICSSGEKESKSVLCLFDDYLKSWVCVDWTSRIPFFWYVSFSQKASIPLLLNFSISLYNIIYSLIYLLLCLLNPLCDTLHFQNKQNPGVPKPRIFTVGRLDVATTGLIILTNDGMHIAIAKSWIPVT